MTVLVFVWSMDITYIAATPMVLHMAVEAALLLLRLAAR
jgi:hypothetical protein